LLFNPVLLITAAFAPGVPQPTPAPSRARCINTRQTIDEHLTSASQQGVTQFTDPTGMFLKYTSRSVLIGQEVAGHFLTAEIPLRIFRTVLSTILTNEFQLPDLGKSSALRAAEYLFASKGHLQDLLPQNPLFRELPIREVGSKEEMLKELDWNDCE